MNNLNQLLVLVSLCVPDVMLCNVITSIKFERKRLPNYLKINFHAQPSRVGSGERGRRGRGHKLRRCLSKYLYILYKFLSCCAELLLNVAEGHRQAGQSVATLR